MVNVTIYMWLARTNEQNCVTTKHLIVTSPYSTFWCSCAYHHTACVKCPTQTLTSECVCVLPVFTLRQKTQPQIRINDFVVSKNTVSSLRLGLCQSLLAEVKLQQAKCFVRPPRQNSSVPFWVEDNMSFYQNTRSFKSCKLQTKRFLGHTIV